MAAPTIPRTTIPLFSKAELDRADLCARALWHGISYKTGKKIASDAELLERFATPFYNIPIMGSYAASPNDIHELMIACELKVLYRGGVGMDFHKGLASVSTRIFYIYSWWLTRSIAVNDEGYGAKGVEELSEGLSSLPNGNRIVLASRMLFFIAPNMQCFNMNNKVARAFGLQSRPPDYRDEFCTLMANGLRTNNKLLSTYKVPNPTNGLGEGTYSKVAHSDWWQRRVMDIAILIRLGLVVPVAGLHGKLTTHLAEEAAKLAKAP